MIDTEKKTKRKAIKEEKPAEVKEKGKEGRKRGKDS